MPDFKSNMRNYTAQFLTVTRYTCASGGRRKVTRVNTPGKVFVPCEMLCVQRAFYGLMIALISSYITSTNAPPTPRRTLEKAPLKKAPKPSWA